MFKGLGQLGDMAGLMKQAKEIQDKMAEAQKEIETLQTEGEAGAGLVRAVVIGKGKLESLTIDPSILRDDSKDIVEDLIVAAVKDAQSKASQRAKERMAEITNGLPMPGGFKLPF